MPGISIGIPHKQRAHRSGECVGSIRPAPNIAYFPSRPGALASVVVKVCFGTFRQILLPSDIEFRPGNFETGAGAVDTVQRIETAAPAPLIDVDGDAGADSDRADLHVAIENMP